MTELEALLREGWWIAGGSFSDRMPGEEFWLQLRRDCPKRQASGAGPTLEDAIRSAVEQARQEEAQ